MFIFTVIVGCVVAFFFREQIGDLLMGLMDDAVTGFVSAWSVVRWFIAGGIILWLASIFAIVKIGDYANAGAAIWIFLGVLPIFLIALARATVANRPVAQLTSVVTGLVVLISGGALLVGLWSPSVKSSLDRWSGNSKQTIANKLDKESLNSEPEVGVKGVLTQETAVYDEKSTAFPDKIKSGTKVLVVSLEKGGPKGMVFVKLQNPQGDFTEKSDEVFIPTEKIAFAQ